jgi:hypothetical protein
VRASNHEPLPAGPRCFLAGLVIYLISVLWILVLAFRRNFWLGCICVVFPVFQLVYVMTNWRDSHCAFYAHLAGYALVFTALGIAYFTGQIHPVHGH